MPKVTVVEFLGGKKAAELRLRDGSWAVLTAPRAITWLRHQVLPVDLVVGAEDFWTNARLLANGFCQTSTGYRLLVLEAKTLKPRPSFVMQDWGYIPDRHSSQAVRVGDLVVVSGWGHGSEFHETVFQVSEELFNAEGGAWDSFGACGWIPKPWKQCLLPPSHPLVERALQSPSLWWVDEVGRCSSLLTLCQECGEFFDSKICPVCGARRDWVARCSHNSYAWDDLRVEGGCSEERAKSLFAGNNWERECSQWNKCPAGHACLSPHHYKKVGYGEFRIK